MQTSSSETSTLTSKMRYQIGNFVCPKCQMVFNNAYALGGHQNAHRPFRLITSSSSIEDSDDARFLPKKTIIGHAQNQAAMVQFGGHGYKAHGFLKVKQKATDDQFPEYLPQRKISKVHVDSNSSDSETTITDPMVKNSRKVDDGGGYDGDIEVSSKRATQDFFEYSTNIKYKGLEYIDLTQSDDDHDGDDVDLDLKLGFGASD